MQMRSGRSVQDRPPVSNHPCYPPHVAFAVHSAAWAIWTKGKPLAIRASEATASKRTTLFWMVANILSLPNYLLEGPLSVAPSWPTFVVTCRSWDAQRPSNLFQLVKAFALLNWLQVSVVRPIGKRGDAWNHSNIAWIGHRMLHCQVILPGGWKPTMI